MPKIMGIDYGTKRCGIAETDDLQIIASSLTTVPTIGLDTFLKNHLATSKVEAIVVGQPFRMSGEVSEVEDHILRFIIRFTRNHPEVAVHRINEAYTSKLAMQTMIQSGAKKKVRREKGNLDKISATIILQQFLETKRNQIKI
jgi:putative Holliday junction resolvase